MHSAAAVGAGANKGGKTLLFFQLPLGAEEMFKPCLQTAKAFGVSDFQA